MHIMESIAGNMKCKICKEGYMIDPVPILILDNPSYECWCDTCNAYHVVFSNRLGQVTIRGTEAENAESLRVEVDKLAVDGRVQPSKQKQGKTPHTSKQVRSQPLIDSKGDKDTEMPQIVEDFDPKIRRTGSGSGRPQIFHIDLKPLDQVAGKTNAKGDPVFVRYVRDDLDGAANATFQQQVRGYAENMDKGSTKHGYRAVVRTDPVMEEDADGNASPVTDDEGKEVVDFYVAVVPVTDRDLARRQSYANAKRGNGNGKAEDGTGNESAEGDKQGAAKGKEKAKA